MNYNIKPILVTDNFDNYSCNFENEGPFDDLYNIVNSWGFNVIKNNAEIFIIIIIMASYLFYMYNQKKKNKNKKS